MIFITTNIILSKLKSNYSAHTQIVTLTRCNFTESVTWFGWYTAFGEDDVIYVLMTSLWIFITVLLGSRLFILFVNHKIWQLPKAHKSTQHATKMLEDNWPFSHQTFSSKISTTSCIQDLPDYSF